MHIKRTLQHFTLTSLSGLHVYNYVTFVQTFTVVSIHYKVVKPHTCFIFLFSVLVTGLMMSYSSPNMWLIVPCIVSCVPLLGKRKISVIDKSKGMYFSK